MADYNKAREGISDRKFKAEVLDLLERIAISQEKLANPLLTITSAPLEPAEYREEVVGEMKVLKENKKLEPLQMIQATHCNCGNNFDRICTQCTPARLAEAYNRREE